MSNLAQDKPQAEAAVLGSCLLDEKAMNWAYHHVDEDHFFDTVNKKLFLVMKRLFKAGSEVDFTIVTNSLTPHEQKTIGIEYVISLHNHVQRVHNIQHYASLMRKDFVQRELEKNYAKVKADPFNVDTQKEIRRLWDMMNTNGNTIVSIKDAVSKYSETLEARKGGKADRIMTGWKSLDEIIAGFYRQNLVVVGARTSVGKSAFLLNLAVKFLQENRRILFISAEMSWDELLDRMMANMEPVFVSKLRSGNLSNEDWGRVNKVLPELYEKQMWGIEGGRMSLSRVRMAVEVAKPDIVFVDFIQRFTPPSYNMSRASYISDVANDLKTIAMENKIVVIAASQLNREMEKDKGEKEPRLDHLKESGGIEESGDLVLLIKGGDDIEGGSLREMKVFISKNRNGPTGKVDMLFDKARTKFIEKNFEVDLPPEHWTDRN